MLKIYQELLSNDFTHFISYVTICMALSVYINCSSFENPAVCMAGCVSKCSYRPASYLERIIRGFNN